MAFRQSPASLLAGCWLFLALASPASCRRAPIVAAIDASADSAGLISAQPAMLDAAAATIPSVVAYDCVGVAPAAPSACVTTKPEDSLVAVAHLLPDLVENHAASDDVRWEQLERALRLCADVRLESLAVEARIAVQNAALLGAIAAHAGKRAPLELAANALVRRLALPAATLEALGSAPDPRIEEWIGPHADWIDRKATSLRHDLLYASTRSFRPMQTRGAHVVISQLIAIDDKQQPHITPVIGSLELRRGSDLTGAACVAGLELRMLRCGAAAGLHAPATAGQVPRSGFILLGKLPDGTEGLRCNTCHQQLEPPKLLFGQPLLPVRGPEAAEMLRERELSLLAASRTELAQLGK